MNDDRALFEAVQEAIRCTAFIPDPSIRAKYVVGDLRSRGLDVVGTTRRRAPVSDPRFDLCVCSFPRWRHPATKEQAEIIMRTTDGTPHHLFIDPPDVIVTRRGPKGRFVKAGS